MSESNVVMITMPMDITLKLAEGADNYIDCLNRAVAIHALNQEVLADGLKKSLRKVIMQSQILERLLAAAK